MSGDTFFAVVGVISGILYEIRIFNSAAAAIDYAAKLAKEIGFDLEDQNEDTGNWHSECKDIWTRRVDVEEKEN